MLSDPAPLAIPGDSHIFPRLLREHVFACVVVDAPIVQAHACADHVRALLPLHLQRAPQDAPPPDKHAEGTLDRHAVLALHVVPRVLS